jgi:3-hydroxyacyl-[acyl-carrier-protein] dehydratase
MPPSLLFDPNEYDLTKLILNREQIYEQLPHRYEFMLLDGIIMLDPEAERMIAFADVRRDAWWARGHIPGRPILPGVLMIEMAAHAAAYYTLVALGYQGFLVFTAVDECRFRGLVEPPCRLYFIGIGIDLRPRRAICAFQALLNGRIVLEAKLTGIPVA